MTQYVFYRLADIVIRAEFDFEFYSEISYMKDFQISSQEEYDFQIIFEQVRDLERFLALAGEQVSEYGPYQYFMNKEGKEYCFFKYNQFLHAVSFIEGKQLRCYYVSKHWLKEITSNGFPLENFFLMERILMENHSMVLHSCYIQKEGKAILFSAPSGTGKSTQGKLWSQYAGAEVINGDRTLIRCVNGNWMAYGAPFCGTSGISINKKVPLNVIVILRQAANNRMRMLSGKEAFYAIYSELTIHIWDKIYVEKALDFVTELLEKIPVVLFECTKEPEAVFVLERFLTENNCI